MITIGIDPHKRSLTAAALDPHSRLLGQLRLPATSQAAPQLLAWAGSLARAALGGRGRQRPGPTASPSCWSPPASTSWTCPPSWPPGPGCSGPAAPARPTWPTPCSVAAAAIHHRRLRPVALEDQTVILRLLVDRRDDLVAERTRTLSRLHVLLATCTPAAPPAS